MSANILEQTSADVNSGFSYHWTPRHDLGMFGFGKCFGFSRVGASRIGKDFVIV